MTSGKIKYKIRSYLLEKYDFSEVIMASGKHILGMPKGKYIFGTVKVGEKGQIVIPKEARDTFSIKPGDTLLVLGDAKTGIIVSKPDIVNEVALGIFHNMEDNK